MFWGLLLEEGKFYSQKVTKSFHVSMAALEPSGKGGSPVTVNLEQDGMDFILCTLKEESLYQQPLDLNFAENDEIKFFLSGKGTVHLTGFVVSDEESDEELEEEESDAEPPQLTEAVTEKPKEAEKISEKKAVKEAKDESEESDEESDEDSDEDSEEDTSPPKTKKPAVPDKKVKPEKKPEKPAEAKKEEKAEEDSDEDDSDDDDSDDEEAVIDFKKLMQAASSDDDDDDDVDMEEMDDEEEEESDDDSSEEEESPPKKAKKTPPVTPNAESSKGKKDKKTPEAKKEVKKEKVKAAPEPVKSGKKRKEIDSPQVNGVETSSKKNKKNKKDKEKVEDSPQVKTPKRSIKGGIVVEDLKVGTGPEAPSGKYVNVYYSGKLKSNSKVFDANTSGKGFKFRLGGGEVIKGWDLGVVGMKVGGKRRLTVPYKMAYGEKGCAPEIPPKADLVFDVELKNVH